MTELTTTTPSDLTRPTDAKVIQQIAARSGELGALLNPEQRDRFMRTCLLHLRQRPELTNAQTDAGTVIASVYSAARLGLEVGSDAYLVTFKGVCQLIPSYKGLAKLMITSGHAVDVGASQVHEGEHYVMQFGEVTEHRNDPACWDRPVLFWYGWAKLRNGERVTQVVTPAKMDELRKKGAAKSDSPWRTNPREMEYKSCIRALANRGRILMDPTVADQLAQLEAQYTIIENEPRHSAIARASLHALPAGHNLPAIDHETPAAPMRDAAPDDVPVIDVTEN
jgi:phage RecT family recombinase